MCGRLAVLTEAPTLADIFGASLAPGCEPSGGPRYNVAPSALVPTLRSAPNGRLLEYVCWGIRLGRADARPRVVINARAETLDRRPLFRGSLSDGRCAVLADAFYEWRREHGRKRAYLIRRRDRKPMALAALRSVGSESEGESGAVAIVTTEANDPLRPLHHRMPAILDRDGESAWIGRDGPVGRESLMRPPGNALEIVPVGSRVNNARFDDQECMTPRGRPIREPGDWADGAAGPVAAQISLF